MHNSGVAFEALQPGDRIGPFGVVVSAAANERYWRAAGVENPALERGVLYPPIAANLTVLAFQARCPEPVIQARQRLVCHRTQVAGVELVATGAVTDRYEKRGRQYVDLRVTITSADRPDDPLWTSEVSFTPTATLGAKS